MCALPEKLKDTFSDADDAPEPKRKQSKNPKIKITFLFISLIVPPKN
jgi:hypothetical protein